MIQQQEQSAAQIASHQNEKAVTAREERAVEQAQSAADNQPRRLAAGDWLRAVMGFRAPFGHDGLPTVWG